MILEKLKLKKKKIFREENLTELICLVGIKFFVKQHPWSFTKICLCQEALYFKSKSRRPSKEAIKIVADMYTCCRSEQGGAHVNL